MFPRNGFDCVNRVFDKAIVDKVPFDTKTTSTNTKTTTTSTINNNNSTDHQRGEDVTKDPMSTIATMSGAVSLIHESHSENDNLHSPIRTSNK